MSHESEHDNEMDRLLQGAFESRPRSGGSSPSMIDVRHRARRHQRRRVGGVVGVTAVLGVSGVAVLASRGSSETSIAGDEATTTWAMTDAGPMCGYTPVGAATVTTITFENSFENASSTLDSVPTTFPSEATSTTLSGSSGCALSGQFRCIGNNGMDEQGYTYFEYCEPIDYANNTMPDSTTYEVFETTTTIPPATTTTDIVFDLATTPAMATTTT